MIKRKPKTKFPRTAMLSKIVNDAWALRAEKKIGVSKSSWLEMLLRRELRNEILEIENNKSN